MIYLIISFVAAYLIGSFPTSFIVAKLVKGIDIRQAGSKNQGATNVLRTVGKLPALITLIVDILKGVFVVTVVANFFYSFSKNLDYDFYRASLGVIVICGHIWSAFMGFRGGKGVATTLGVAATLVPEAVIPSLVIWLVLFLTTSYVSLASVIAVLSFPVIIVLSNHEFYETIFSLVVCSIILYKHKENIKRLVRGEESKTIIFRKR